jgi:hypothetical protein
MDARPAPYLDLEHVYEVPGLQGADNIHSLQLLSTTVLTLQSTVLISHLFVDQELLDQVR